MAGCALVTSLWCGRLLGIKNHIWLLPWTLLTHITLSGSCFTCLRVFPNTLWLMRCVFIYRPCFCKQCAYHLYLELSLQTVVPPQPPGPLSLGGHLGGAAVVRQEAATTRAARLAARGHAAAAQGRSAEGAVATAPSAATTAAACMILDLGAPAPVPKAVAPPVTMGCIQGAAILTAFLPPAAAGAPASAAAEAVAAGIAKAAVPAEALPAAVAGGAAREATEAAGVADGGELVVAVGPSQPPCPQGSTRQGQLALGPIFQPPCICATRLPIIVCTCGHPHESSSGCWR